MIEQSIYSRASNTHTNADGQRIGIGYGRVACTRGFGAIGSMLDKTVSAYPCSLMDSRGAFPKVMAKYEVEIENRPIQVLQQVTRLQMEGERPFHVGHQFAVGEESAAAFAQDPLLWMRLFFLDSHREPIDFRLEPPEAFKLTEAQKYAGMLKPSLDFPMAPLSEVLRFFNMVPEEFEFLLASLFDVGSHDSIFALIMFDDTKPDYPLWIRRLIVHIYTFLPCSMRRKIGFETWFTGAISTKMCQLCFASYRNLSNASGRLKLRFAASAEIDVTNCFVFFGQKLLHIKHPDVDETCAGDTSFRRLIRPWIASAMLPQQCLAVEEALNSQWKMFDGTPDGKDARCPDAFSNLLAYQNMQARKFEFRWGELAAFAERFCRGMGEAGDAALAGLLSAYCAGDCAFPAAIDALCSLLDRERFGPETARAATRLFVGVGGAAQVKISQLKYVLKTIRENWSQVGDELLGDYIGRAVPDIPAQKALLALIGIAGDGSFSDGIRSAACRRFALLLPERVERLEHISEIYRAAKDLGLERERIEDLLAAAIGRAGQDRTWVEYLLDFAAETQIGPRASGAVLAVAEKYIRASKLPVREALTLIGKLAGIAERTGALPATREVLRHIGALSEGDAASLLSGIAGLERHFAPDAGLRAEALRRVLDCPDLGAEYRPGIAGEQLGACASLEPVVCEFLDARKSAGNMTWSELSATVALASNQNATDAIRSKVTSAVLSYAEQTTDDLNAFVCLSEEILRLPEPMRDGVFCRVLSGMEVRPEMASALFEALKDSALRFEPTPNCAGAARNLLARALDALPVDPRALDNLSAILEHYSAALGPGAAEALLQKALQALAPGDIPGIDYMRHLLAVHARYAESVPGICPTVRQLLREGAEKYPFDIDGAADLLVRCRDALGEHVGDVARRILAGVPVRPEEGAKYLRTVASLVRSGCVDPGSAASALDNIARFAGAVRLHVSDAAELVALKSDDKIACSDEALVALLERADVSAEDFAGDLGALALCCPAGGRIAEAAFRKAIASVEKHPVAVEEIDAWTAHAGFAACPRSLEILENMLRHIQPPEEGRERATLRLLDFVRGEFGSAARAAEERVLLFLESTRITHIADFFERARGVEPRARDLLIARAIDAVQPEGDAFRSLKELNDVAESTQPTGKVTASIEVKAKSLAWPLEAYDLYRLAGTLSASLLKTIALDRLLGRIRELPEDREAALKALMGPNCADASDETFVGIYERTRELYATRPGDQAEVCEKILNYVGVKDCKNGRCLLEQMFRLIAVPENSTLILAALAAAMRRLLDHEKTTLVEGNVACFPKDYRAWIHKIEDSALPNRDQVTAALIRCCARNRYFSDGQFDELLGILKGREGTEPGEAAFDGICSIVEMRIQTGVVSHKRYRECVSGIGDERIEIKILSRCIVKLEKRRPGLDSFLKQIWQIWSKWRQEYDRAGSDAGKVLRLHEWIVQWMYCLWSEAVRSGDGKYREKVYASCIDSLGASIADAKFMYGFLGCLERSGRLDFGMLSGFLTDLFGHIRESFRKYPLFLEQLFDPSIPEGIAELPRLDRLREAYEAYLAVRLDCIAQNLVGLLCFKSGRAKSGDALAFLGIEDASAFPNGWRKLFERSPKTGILRAAEVEGFRKLCRAYIREMSSHRQPPFTPFWVRIADRLPENYFADAGSIDADALSVLIVSAVSTCKEMRSVKEAVRRQVGARFESQLQLSYREANKAACNLLAFQMRVPKAASEAGPGNVQEPQRKSAPAEYRVQERINYIALSGDADNAVRIVDNAFQEGLWNVLDLLENAYQAIGRGENMVALCRKLDGPISGLISKYRKKMSPVPAILNRLPKYPAPVQQYIERHRLRIDGH